MTNRSERDNSSIDFGERIENSSKTEVLHERYIPDFALLPDDQAGFRALLEEFVPVYLTVKKFPIPIPDARKLVSSHLTIDVKELEKFDHYIAIAKILPTVDLLTAAGIRVRKAYDARAFWGYVSLSEEIKSRIDNVAWGSEIVKAGVERGIEDKWGRVLFDEIFEGSKYKERVLEREEVTETPMVYSKENDSKYVTDEQFSELQAMRKIPEITEKNLEKVVADWDVNLLTRYEKILEARGIFESIPLGMRVEGNITRDAILAIQFCALFHDVDQEGLVANIQNFTPFLESEPNNKVFKSSISKTLQLLRAMSSKDPKIINLAVMFRVFRDTARDMGYMEHSSAKKVGSKLRSKN